ncbi:hypothetical protein DM47_2670 [Burkholderia mallei]|nr:hypothetical protein DM46_2424 [Burkholderia mallei]KOS91566.1 hypothetical protein DM45_1985 [Burkholderia mallei]KOT21225.1 hypothetical protein DM47_2670 [Burkholderia mallei]
MLRSCMIVRYVRSRFQSRRSIKTRETWLRIFDIYFYSGETILHRRTGLMKFILKIIT